VVRPFAFHDESSVNHVVSLSGLDVRRRAPFDCQQQVGGWESVFHGANKAVRICGLGEFLFERQ